MRVININDATLDLTITSFSKDSDEYIELLERKTGIKELIGPMDLIVYGKNALHEGEKRLRYKVAQWYDENQ